MKIISDFNVNCGHMTMCCVLWFLFAFVFAFASGSVSLCEDGFCNSYVATTGCSAPAPECRDNNATHRGMELLSPTECNCCEYCMPLYGAGEACSAGGPGAGLGVGRCGDGLACHDNRCRRMDASESACHAQQDAFDARAALAAAGITERRPLCDGKGRFAPARCVPTQTCFCQSEDGERIFGEKLYRGTSTLQEMNCACSRLAHKIATSINPGVRFPVVPPICTVDGSFNPIQCIDRVCYCVDTGTGVRVGEHEINLDERPISALPCYDPNLDQFPEPASSRPPHNRTTPCLDNMAAKMAAIEQSERDGYIVDYFSGVEECLPDGSFGRIGYVNDTKICIDERGERIGEYQALPDTASYRDMDCKCAVTSKIMASVLEQPVCCPNGNFRPLQCRRGACHCVDQDGAQTVQESADINTLPCGMCVT